MPLLAADPVTVLPDQRKVLEQLVRTHSTPQQLALRARIIVDAAEGVGVRESARELEAPSFAFLWGNRPRAPGANEGSGPLRAVVRAPAL